MYIVSGFSNTILKKTERSISWVRSYGQKAGKFWCNLFAADTPWDEYKEMQAQK